MALCVVMFQDKNCDADKKLTDMKKKLEPTPLELQHLQHAKQALKLSATFSVARALSYSY